MIAQKAQHMPGDPDKVRVLQRKLLRFPKE
jgi:hypothetical protein